MSGIENGARTQILYDEAGKPAFAVIPWTLYSRMAEKAETLLSDEELYDLAKAAPREPGVPQMVMRRLIDGENPLKVYREWRGLTQQALATQASVTPGYISQVERGSRSLSAKARAQFAELLGILPDDLDEA